MQRETRRRESRRLVPAHGTIYRMRETTKKGQKIAIVMGQKHSIICFPLSYSASLKTTNTPGPTKSWLNIGKGEKKGDDSAPAVLYSLHVTLRG